MDKPLIPDLKNQLKKMIINFIRKYKYEIVYTYQIIPEEEYSISKASLNYIYKIIYKLGNAKYYLHNITERIEIAPLSEEVNELPSGAMFGWDKLSKLFKEDSLSNIRFNRKNYYRDREFYDIYPPLENEDFLEELLDEVVYKLHGSSIVRNFIELHEIIGCELGSFEFTGLESMENIPIKVCVSCLSLGKKRKLSFDIAPEYINNFLPNIQKNRRFYKDEGYYQNKKCISNTLASNFLMISDDRFRLPEDGIPDEFVDELASFIHDDAIFVMRIDTEFNSDNAREAVDSHYFTGLKIYKIPEGPFNWEPELKKIENKLKKLNKEGDFMSESEVTYKMNSYRYFSLYNMSFECSLDNYLEIYATKEALELFFLPGTKNNLESLNAVYPMASLKWVYIVDHYKELCQPLFQVAIYKHHFGSKNNNFYNEDFIFDYDE